MLLVVLEVAALVKAPLPFAMCLPPNSSISSIINDEQCKVNISDKLTIFEIKSANTIFGKTIFYLSQSQLVPLYSPGCQ